MAIRYVPQERLRPYVRDGRAVSPDDLGERLWTALALLVCGKRIDHPVEDRPCRECLRFTKPLLKPFSRCLLVCGRRESNDYHLVGRALEYLFLLAEEDIDTWEELQGREEE